MLVDIKMFLKMSLSLTHVITVVPLRKPREKLLLKRSCVKEKANQITQVLEKFEKVDDNRDDSLLRPRRNSKNESDNRPAVSNLKGVSRESPGMSAPLETKGMVKRAAKSCNVFWQLCRTTTWSWTATLRVLPRTNKTCLKTNQVVAGCEKVCEK